MSCSLKIKKRMAYKKLLMNTWQFMAIFNKYLNIIIVI